ncbi:hypothetical protein [Janibacter anophelis]|nr:hypothetical protein [Janibacter anophelis]
MVVGLGHDQCSAQHVGSTSDVVTKAGSAAHVSRSAATVAPR